jgi:plastocyanin
MSRVAVRTVIIASLALLPAAPVGADAVQPDDGFGQRQRAPVVRVRMLDGLRFGPAIVRIDRGTRVRWVNASGLTHTTSSNAGAWDRSLGPGERFTRRFRTTGRFPYHCEIHAGMTGTIVVR